MNGDKKKSKRTNPSWSDRLIEETAFLPSNENSKNKRSSANGFSLSTTCSIQFFFLNFSMISSASFLEMALGNNPAANNQSTASEATKHFLYVLKRHLLSFTLTPLNGSINLFKTSSSSIPNTFWAWSDPIANNPDEADVERESSLDELDIFLFEWMDGKMKRNFQQTNRNDEGWRVKDEWCVVKDECCLSVVCQFVLPSLRDKRRSMLYGLTAR